MATYNHNLEIFAEALASKFSASVRYDGNSMRVKGDDFALKPGNPFKRDRVRVEAVMADDFFSLFMPPRWKITVKSGDWLSGRGVSRKKLTQKFDWEASADEQKAVILERISHLAAHEQIDILNTQNGSEKEVEEILQRDLEL